MPEIINPDNPDDELTAGGIEKNKEAFLSAKARFSVDANGLVELNRAFGSLNRNVSVFKKEITSALAVTRQFQTAVGGLSSALGKAGGGMSTFTASGGSTAAGGIQSMPDMLGSGSKPGGYLPPGPTPAGTPPGGTPASGDGTGDSTGGGRVKKFINYLGGGAATISAGADILTGLLQTSAKNIQGRAPYTLTADRTGLLFRQMFGGTQLQYQSRWRQPLTGRMIGPEGIEDMLKLQTTMGIDPASMLSGVEGIRVASGFGYSTADATRMIEALGSPGSSNMMTLMLGTGLWGPGGQARDPMDVIRTVVQRMGLTNESMVRGAFQPGSMTRSNLARTGLPMDMQDMVLQYAMQNIEYRERGGKGMYDPSNEAHRNRMGLDNEYAIEREKTGVLEAERAERFYRRQVDNFAQLERNTQALIKTFGLLEDRLSGIVGGQINVTGHPVTRLLGGTAGVAGMLMGLTGATPAGAVIAGVGSLLGAIGDPAPDITEPGMDASFQSSLRSMAAAAADEGHNLTLTSGVRDVQRQRELFLERHDEDPNGEREFEGKRYTLNAVGEAKGYAAPPGSSLHEVGMAADLGPESAWPWIKANAARFGLRTAPDEDWHVAPAGMTRAKYNATHGKPSQTSSRTTAARPTSQSTGGSALSSAPQRSASNVHMTRDMHIPEAIRTYEMANAARVRSGVGDESPGTGASVTIAPVIHLNGTGNDAADAQRLAQKVIQMIETSEAVRSLRRS